MEYSYLNKVTEGIHLGEGKDDEPKYLFAEAVNNPTFKHFVKENVELINTTLSLLKQPRSKSIHPSASLILPKEKTIFEWIPIRKEGDALS